MNRSLPTAAEILAELVRAPSVTPDAAAALDVVARHLAPFGFVLDRPVFSDAASAPVENLFAAVGTGGRHLTLAGHVDVVPPGLETLWRHPPFAAEVADGVLYGRGAADMKGGLAAMLAAAIRFVSKHGTGFAGRLSFLITGDEEADAVNGTVKLLAWAAARGERFSAALVGEPTSVEATGDQIKIGRRGSFSATLIVEGTQGHAAYPQKSDNPIRGLTDLLHALLSKPLDAGTEHFEPSTLEVVSVDVGNPTWNVIPAEARARINSRHNDGWTAATLRAELESRFAAAAENGALAAKRPVRWRLVPEPSRSDVFLTRDEDLIATVSGAIAAVTGRRPTLSTGGGTSDARFIKDYCPVVEFGPVGTSMHQVDEHVSLDAVEKTALIYEAILERYFLQG